MRVILNGIAALERKTGVGHYIDSLYRHLLLYRQEDDITFYPKGITQQAIRFAREWIFQRTKQGAMSFANAPSTKKKSAPIPAMVQQSREVARNFARRVCHKHFRVISQQTGCDLYHEPNYLPWPSELPTVVTILDLSVLLHPEWHPVDRVKSYEKHFFRGLSYCQHFIAISEFTRQEMIQNLGIAPERVSAIHIGIRSGFRPMSESEVRPVLQELGLPQNYLLYVGTIEPRKNILMLMQAYVALPESLRRQHPLVLVGSWGWKAKEISDYYESIGQAAGVMHFGYLPDPYLPALLNGARAMVYPSFYEGFGLPPVEMLACGGAVLASTADSLIEVMQDKGTLLPADDESTWHDAMLRILTDDDWHRQLRQDVIPFASRYTWDECAKQTWQVYRSLHHK